MIQTIRGLHHVTAIAIDPQANIDFYTQVLGLRLVKDTVNFDDPSTYHFYYGDRSGNPGTILTFFPFVLAGRGRSGSGMVDTVTFAVPAKSLDGWMGRLAERGIDFDGPFTRFSRPMIEFRDPDGSRLEIAAVDGPAIMCMSIDCPYRTSAKVLWIFAPPAAFAGRSSPSQARWTRCCRSTPMLVPMRAAWPRQRGRRPARRARPTV